MRMPAAAVREHAWLALVFLFALYLNHTSLWMGGPTALTADGRLWLFADEGTVMYDSLRIASGQTMYDEFFGFQGPIYFYLNALVLWFTGPSVLACRVVSVTVAATSAVFIAVLVHRMTASRIAGAAAAFVHGAAFVPFWPCSYPHWVAECLVLGGLVAATSPTPRRVHRGLAGAAFMGAVFTIQSLGLPALIAAVGGHTFFGLRDRSWRSAARDGLEVLAGAGAVLGFMAVFFGVQGALPEMIYDMFVWPFSNYGKGQADVTSMAQYANLAVKEHYAKLPSPYSWLGAWTIQISRAMPYFTLPALVGALLWTARVVWTRRGESFAPVLVSGVACAVSLPVILLISRADMTHVAFIASFGLLALTALFAPLRRLRFGPHGSAVVVTVIFAIAGASQIGKISRTERDPRDWREYLLAMGESRAIKARLGDEAPLFDVSYWGALRYFYMREAATPHTYVPPSNARTYYSDAQWRTIGEALLNNAPRVLNVDNGRWTVICEYTPALKDRYRRHGSLMVRVQP